MSTAIVSYQPQNLDQLESFSERLSRSGNVPQQYRNKPSDIIVACLWGWETAQLTPLISLSVIDVIQGRAAYRAEALLGIALKLGHITDAEETYEGEPGSDDRASVCTVTKANGSKVTGRFSVRDAKKAGLFGKEMWAKWTDRMLRARARGFAVRDASPQAFLGYVAEEVRDFDEQGHVGPERAKNITPANDTAHVPAVEIVAPAATTEVDMIRVFDTDGTVWSVGATIREGLQIYGDLKKARSDKATLACANLDLLRSALDVAPAGSVLAGKLQAEIEAAEALTDAMDGMHAEPASGADATTAEPVREAA